MIVDFSVTDDLAVHRDAARLWVRAHVRRDWAREQYASGTRHTAELHARLARDGILGAGWPLEHGGSDTDPAFARAVLEEIEALGIGADAWAMTRMVIRTIAHAGTEGQKQTVIPSALRGAVLIGLGYTEPDSGSDVAAAKTTAVRDGQGWVLNGQKMFTSTAQVCTHIFVLTRTNHEVPKHRGLTMFLVPTTAPGFEIQPVHTLGGQRTNATFYADVRVPDSARVGGVDEGWAVMHVALTYERSLTGRGTAGTTLAARIAAWAQVAERPDGTSYYADPWNRERLARIAIDEEVGRLLGIRVRCIADRGALPGVEGTMAKLFTSEAAKRHQAELLDLLGPFGVLQPGADDAPLDGELEAAFRAAVVGTIYGGSSEILREIVAERGLGLPRNRPHR